MKPRYLDRIDMFPTPVWRYKFPDFEEKKSELLEYLNQDSMYFTGAERNGLQTTEGNLHDKTLYPKLSEVTDFFQDIFEDVMIKCGYQKDVGITSLWSTRQKQTGFHHEHIHANTFLAAVMYLHDESGGARGTSFKNSNSAVRIIQPRVNHNARPFFRDEDTMPFVEGMAIVFPAWAMHSAPQNDSSCRIILGANCMPVGRTNSDHFNQYVFPKPSDFGFLPLKQNIESGYRK